MAFLNSLNIGASALTAQRFRMDVISQNLANIDTTRTADGTPYRRKQVVFQEKGPESFVNVLNKQMTTVPGGGVRVKKLIQDDEPLVPKYDPSHPDADKDGYVMMPNVDNLEEMIDMMSATASYTANINAINAVKRMAANALQIGR
ncbi:MAG: flagellar basal body rod protein FlgC [Oscillospiraceae bacterium]